MGTPVCCRCLVHSVETPPWRSILNTPGGLMMPYAKCSVCDGQGTVPARPGCGRAGYLD
jgi:hypothetical protein